MLHVLSIFALLFGSTAFAAKETKSLGHYNCRSYGHTFSVNSDTLKSYWVDSRIYFSLEKDNNETVAMTDIGGHVEVSAFVERALEPMELPDRYALFKIESLKENPKYKGRKYTNHHQFREFNDTTTFGSETGMWGTFVVSKEFSMKDKKFDAHYIMQAGDHMGGTIHYSCESGQ